MKHWLTSTNKKRHQRAMNKLIREANKNLERDVLWCGRFMIQQIESPQWFKYEDNSGADLYVVLKFIDKCTGHYFIKFDSVNHWRGSYGNGYHLWQAINDFIVLECNVWSEELAQKRDFNAWSEYNKTVRKVE